jgi:hypothetical protein
MQVDTPGAVKLTRHYGDSLVCVRYRLSPDGSERITTVELALEKVRVQRRANPIVAVKIYASEPLLVAKAKAKGGRYNPKTRLWKMHLADAHNLGLRNRIARHAGQKQP